MTTRKKLTILIAVTLILGILFCFSGCSKTKEFELTESEVNGLVAISREKNFIEGYAFDQYILYDPDTHVMYSMIVCGEGLSMTPLYNADGSLKVCNLEK